jgi:hypothetical protein
MLQRTLSSKMRARAGQRKLSSASASSSDAATSSSRAAAVRARALELASIERDARALAASWKAEPAITQDEMLAVSNRETHTPRKHQSGTACTDCECPSPARCHWSGRHRRCRSRSPCYGETWQRPVPAYVLRGVLPRPISPVFVTAACAAPCFSPPLLVQPATVPFSPVGYFGPAPCQSSCGFL